MSSSDDHFAPPASPLPIPIPIPPPATLKTYPTRRRIIRRSSRNSIRLTTLRKGATIPPPGPTPTPLDSPTDPYHPFDAAAAVAAKSEDGSDSESLLRLFSCVSCGLPLRQPVTLDCGHTCCKGCGDGACPECGAPTDREACINVLVRGIVSKLIGEDLHDGGM